MKSLTLFTLSTMLMAGMLAPMPSAAKTADHSKSSSVSASGKKKGKKSKGKKKEKKSKGKKKINEASKKKKAQTKKQDARKLAVEKLSDLGISEDAYDAKLIEAINNKDEELIKTLILAGVEINKEGEFKLPPLSAAISQELSEDVITTIIEAGADLNGGPDEKTPLCMALKKGKPSARIVKLLLDKGVNIKEADEKSPLVCFAADGGHLDNIKLLIEQGADVNKTDRAGMPAIASIATSLGSGPCTPEDRFLILDTLLKAGANPNAVSRAGYTALVWARDFKCAKRLLDAGASPNVRQYAGNVETALYMAIQKNDVEMVKLLLEAGAYVNDMGTMGTPLGRAVRVGNLECVKCLLAAGASINKSKDHSDSVGQTPLYMAAEQGFTECVRILLDAGANVNKTDAAGKSPLDIATEKGHTACVELLKAAEAKADTPERKKAIAALTSQSIQKEKYIETLMQAIDANTMEQIRTLATASGGDLDKSIKGETPLIKAVRKGNRECVQILIEAGADVEYASPVDIAVRNGQSECLRLLLKAGASPNDLDCANPLCSAIESNKPECVKVLLEFGAKQQEVGQNESALDIAKRYNNETCIKLLEEAVQKK